jgi:hypothetical protein
MYDPENAAWIDRAADQVFIAVTARYPAKPYQPAILSTIRHFFDIDESQARGPSGRVRLSNVAALM